MKSQSSESVYKSFFDNTLDGLAYCKVIFDGEGNPVDFIYLKVNKNFENLTGLKKVAGRKATDMIPGIKKSNPELFDICGRVSLTRQPERFETHIKELSKWFLISVYSPEKEFFVSTFQNTTEQKKTEKDLENAKIAARNVLDDLQIEKEAIAHAKAKDEAMLASIGDGVVIIDLLGEITFINQSAQDMLGWNAAELKGKLLSDLVPVLNERGEVVSLKARSLSVGVSQAGGYKGPGSPDLMKTNGVYYYIRKDKTKFPAAMSFSGVLLDGKVVGAIEVFRDITREKEVDKAKSEFVSLASHQLRTPLTAISWYTEMILKGDVGKVVPQQKKYLQEIYRGNRRMVELVNTLLDVSRLELGTFKIESRPTDVIALAESVLEEQKLKIETKKIFIVEKLEKNLLAVSTDPKLLRMVFQNILNNSLEYISPGGTVKFEVSFNSKNTLMIKISDTGYGIPKNQQEQIFTKLFRADNVRKKETSGTGLGLYIVKSIVENLGGKIWFESEEDRGTTFYVALPIEVSNIKGAIASPDLVKN
jgi:signal transduction histidine kinase